MNGTYYNAWHSKARNLCAERVLLVGDMRVHRLQPFLQAWVSVPVDSFAGNCSGDVEEYCAFLKKWITQYTYSIVILDSSFQTVFTDCEKSLRDALPVIATSVGAIPGMVTDGEMGLIVNEQDVSTLATAMMKIMQEHELSLRIGGKGHNFYLHFYTKLEFERDLMTIIEE